jgi:hypothetical protein
MFCEDDGIPEHLVDDEIGGAIAIVQQCDEFIPRAIQFQPSVGLLIKLVKGLRRLMKRGKVAKQSDDGAHLLWKLYYHYAAPSPVFDCQYWTANQLFITGNNFISECREISPTLLRYALHPITCHAGTSHNSVCFSRDLDRHYLLLPQNDLDIIQLDDAFLERVVAYHKSLERPPSTFEDVHENVEYLKAMAELPRETCPGCGGQRQVSFCHLFLFLFSDFIFLLVV